MSGDSKEPAVGARLLELLPALRLLERTPDLLATWLEDLPCAYLDANEGGATFSPRDIVAHLIHGELEDWIPRVRRLLESGEEVAFEPFDPEGFRTLEAQHPRPMRERLEEFRALRKANLEEISALEWTKDDLLRRGRHPELGSVTLGELLSTWVVHDQAHLAQLARVLSRTLADSIGPWRAYFSALREG